MAHRGERSIQREYTAKIILTLVFLGGFLLFTAWLFLFGPGRAVSTLSALDLALLGLSTYRLGRMIAYDRVMEPLRQFFTETVPDATGAGESVNPKGEGFQQSLGQLICCPICAGTWVAALLTYLYYIIPGPTYVFLVMTSAIAIAELLGALTEAFSWSGQYARTMSGAKMRERAKQEQRVGEDAEEDDEKYPGSKRKRAEPVETYRDYRS